MVKDTDKEIFFPKTFNEQMAWVFDEFYLMLRNNALDKIRQAGKTEYGQNGYTSVINRMFGIIKADSKNKAMLREVNRAESELIAFLYDEPGALTEKEIFEYWQNFYLAYIAELETHSIHYILLKGFDVQNGQNEENEKILGVYDSLAKLQDVYVIEFQKLEDRHKNMTGLIGADADYIVKHEKIMINAYDEFNCRWYYNINPENLFWNKGELLYGHR